MRAITVREAAEVLGMNRRTVLRIIQRGDLRKKPGQPGIILLDAAEVERFRAARAGAVEAQPGHTGRPRKKKAQIPA